MDMYVYMYVPIIKQLTQLVLDGVLYYTCVCFADLADLNLPKTCQMDFPDPDDLLNFRLVIMPDEVYIHVYTCV